MNHDLNYLNLNYLNFSNVPAGEILQLGASGLVERDHGRLEVCKSTFDHKIDLLEMRQQITPEGLLAAAKRFSENLGVAADDHAITGTRQGNVESAGIIQEADTLILVGAYTCKQNEILLATLEAINTRDFNFAVTTRLGGDGALILTLK